MRCSRQSLHGTNPPISSEPQAPRMARSPSPKTNAGIHASRSLSRLIGCSPSGDPQRQIEDDHESGHRPGNPSEAMLDEIADRLAAAGGATGGGAKRGATGG